MDKVVLIDLAKINVEGSLAFASSLAHEEGWAIAETSLLRNVQFHGLQWSYRWIQQYGGTNSR